jgi:hypothetical protein
MEPIYSTEARQDADRFGLLKQASALLEEILGPESSQFVNAQWDRLEDHKGRTMYRLTIRDFTGQVSTDFAPDELQNPLHMRFRMYRLWGDLLQIRNNQQHQQVELISSQMAGDQAGH